MWGKNIYPNLVVCVDTGYDIDNGQQKRTARSTNYGGCLLVFSV